LVRGEAGIGRPAWEAADTPIPAVGEMQELLATIAERGVTLISFMFMRTPFG
jgi:hypothetical protein